MRASDADRDRACDVLKAGFAEGRLRQEEFEARLDRVQRASTYGELHSLVADLPQGPVQAQPAPMPAPMPMPQAQPHWPQAHWPQARYLPMPPPTNGNALGALICGLLSPVTWGLTSIPSVVLGHKARAELRHTHERGDGYALTGLILGYLGIAFWILLIVILVILTN
ncbi:DUF1707 and DUF4190 domain-containing protein [Streptomyces sp. B6B3]|uniref:DUF1707 and DUF4190 domain-containing protein n=1 Tax=Streptomyces sp. B6B3 TaxID=3153570 RepID=UPI00325F284E